jgi:hypothetical protein
MMRPGLSHSHRIWLQRLYQCSMITHHMCVLHWLPPTQAVMPPA